MGKLWKASAAVLLALTAIPTLVLAQAQGTIAGTVTAAENGGPLSGAQVSLEGTVRRTVTDGQGRFRLTAEAGNYTVVVSTLGRQAGRRQVSVAAGGSTTANFSLATSAVALEGITVNAVTGEAERHREVGTAVSSITVGDMNKGPVHTLADVLTARAPGVTLQGAAGTTGTSSRIRIRGANSLSLSNEPLIFVDGVQATNSKGGFGVGGQSPNRLNDINPEDIQNIEVLKGPAASAIYGTAAANGVLLITTKRGRAGRTVWRTYGETGSLRDVTDYPPNYLSVQTLVSGAALYDTVYGYGYSNTTDVFGSGAPYATCTNYNRAQGLCRQDITVSFSPLNDPRTTPYTTGRRGKAGVNVAGGGTGLSYYVSGDIEGERGVLSYNRLERTSFRGNFSADPNSKVSLQLNTSYIGSRLDQVQGDNNVFSPIINGLLGPAQFVPGMNVDSIGAPGSRVASYFGWSNNDDSKLPTRQGVDRMILGANANYRAFRWLTVNGNAGLDFFSRKDVQTIDPASDLGALGHAYDVGYHDSQRSNNYQWTSNVAAIGRFDLSRAVVSTTTAGGSYQRSLFNSVFCEGVAIPSGTSSCSATASQFAISESQTDNRTLGGYVRQEFALNDRMFLAGSVRGDKNSGLVTGFIYYPSASLSWVVSEEPFFPRLSFLSNLRLRTALGSSGQRPDFGQAETLFGTVSAQRAAAEEAGLVLSNTGNADLRPERTREFEFGGDLGLLNDRLSLDFTAYNKKSTDALIARNLEPSAGLTGSVFENLGSIRNSGTELGINALVVDKRNFRLNAHLAASTLHNRILQLGEGIAPITFNRGVQAHREGFSAGGFFAKPYTFTDTNGDGFLSPSEVKVDSSRFITVKSLSGRDTTLALEYVGPSLPTNTQAFSADLTLFRNITFTTVFERRAGNKQMNYSEYFRCVSGTVGLGGCSEAMNPQASLADQARYLAASGRSFGASLRGFIEDATFTKWREFSVRLGAPESLGQRFPLIRGAAFTLSGRNLATWTKYSGLDPEINESGGAANFTQGEFNTQPPVRYWTARVDLTF